MSKAGTFYEYVMAGGTATAAARSVDDFSEEIALLRASLQAEARYRYGHLPAIVRAAEAIAKLGVAHTRLTQGAREDPYAGAAQVIADIRGPVGEIPSPTGRGLGVRASE